MNKRPKIENRKEVLKTIQEIKKKYSGTVREQGEHGVEIKEITKYFRISKSPVSACVSHEQKHSPSRHISDILEH